VEVRGDGRVRVCGRPEPYRYFEQHVRPSLAFVLVSVLPFAVITVSNCLIVFSLLRAHRLRTATLQRSDTTTTSPHDTKVNRSTYLKKLFFAVKTVIAIKKVWAVVS